MPNASRQAVGPAYLLLCLILGGSAQGIMFNLLLQLAGLTIIAWAAIAPAEEEISRGGRQLFLLIIVALVVVALQLVPLPVTVWPHLGPRAPIADGYRVLGMAVPPLP